MAYLRVVFWSMPIEVQVPIPHLRDKQLIQWVNFRLTGLCSEVSHIPTKLLSGSFAGIHVIFWIYYRVQQLHKNLGGLHKLKTHSTWLSTIFCCTMVGKNYGVYCTKTMKGVHKIPSQFWGLISDKRL